MKWLLSTTPPKPTHHPSQPSMCTAITHTKKQNEGNKKRVLATSRPEVSKRTKRTSTEYIDEDALLNDGGTPTHPHRVLSMLSHCSVQKEMRMQEKYTPTKHISKDGLHTRSEFKVIHTPSARAAQQAEMQCIEEEVSISNNTTGQRNRMIHMMDVGQHTSDVKDTIAQQDSVGVHTATTHEVSKGVDSSSTQQYVERYTEKVKQAVYKTKNGTMAHQEHVDSSQGYEETHVSYKSNTSTPTKPQKSMFPHRGKLHSFAKSFSYLLSVNADELSMKMNTLTSLGEYPVSCSTSSIQIYNEMQKSLSGRRGITHPLDINYMAASPEKASPTHRIQSKAESRVNRRLKLHLENDEENSYMENTLCQSNKEIISKESQPANESINEEHSLRYFPAAQPVKPSRDKQVMKNNEQNLNAAAAPEALAVPPPVCTHTASISPVCTHTASISPVCTHTASTSPIEHHCCDSPVHYHKILRAIQEKNIHQNFDIGSFLVLKAGGPLAPGAKPILKDKCISFIPRDWSTEIQAKSQHNSSTLYMQYIHSRARLIPKGIWYKNLLETDSLLSTLQEQSNWNAFSIFGSAPKAIVLSDIFDYSSYAFWCTAEARSRSTALRGLYEKRLASPNGIIPREQWEAVEEVLHKKWDEENKLELDWSMDPLRIDEALWYIDYCELSVDKSGEVVNTEVCFCPTPNPHSQFGWTDIRSTKFQTYRGRRASGNYGRYPFQRRPHNNTPNLSLLRNRTHNKRSSHFGLLRNLKHSYNKCDGTI